MIKQRLLIIGVLMLLATGTLFALHFSSERPNQQKNGFERRIISNAVQPVSEMKLPRDVMSICNVDNNTVYLQTTDPGKIYYTSDLKRLDTLRLKLPYIPKLQRNVHVEVHYPMVYIMAGNARKVITGHIQSDEYQLIDVPTPGSFAKPVLINPNEMIVRCIDTNSLDALFYKINLSNGSVVPEQGISERLGDAGFAHDGLLLYDKNANKLAYVHYYSNSICLFDTSLQPVGRYHTIDTTLIPGISLRINSEGTKSVTTDAPPQMINGAGVLTGGVLYVRSYLQGDDETDFAGKLPIDRYSMETGQYLGSYYLPYPRKWVLRDLVANDEVIYLLFKDRLTSGKIISNQ